METLLEPTIRMSLIKINEKKKWMEIGLEVNHFRVATYVKFPFQFLYIKHISHVRKDFIFVISFFNRFYALSPRSYVSNYT